MVLTLLWSLWSSSVILFRWSPPILSVALVKYLASISATSIWSFTALSPSVLRCIAADSLLLLLIKGLNVSQNFDGLDLCSSALVYQYARIAFLRSRVAIFRYFLFSSRLSGAIFSKLFGVLPFVSQSPFPFLCHVRDILFPYSFTLFLLIGAC